MPCCDTRHTFADTHTHSHTGLKSAAEVTAKSAEVTMDPYGLVDRSEGFYAYPGSLTTPNCNAVVTWVVMHKVSSAFVLARPHVTRTCIIKALAILRMNVS